MRCVDSQRATAKRVATAPGASSHVQAEAVALPRRGHLDDPTATRAHAEQLLDAECALAGIPRVRLADDGEG